MIFGLSYSTFWLFASIVFAVIEAATLGIITIWFAIGAIFSMLAALIGLEFVFQILLFIVISAGLLYFTRPIIKKHLNAKTLKTNADRLVGECADVVETINCKNNTGKVKINGQVWTAKSSSDEEIAEGERVKIIQISGVKLIVEKY